MFVSFHGFGGSNLSTSLGQSESGRFLLRRLYSTRSFAFAASIVCHCMFEGPCGLWAFVCSSSLRKTAERNSATRSYHSIRGRGVVSLILRLNSQLIAKASDFGRRCPFWYAGQNCKEDPSPVDPNIAVHSLRWQPTRRGCHSSSITTPVVCKRGGRL
jgi:hypothetical protein